MLKIKIENIENIKTKISENFVEYEINEVEDRLIFPIYISNSYIEAIELLKEDEYYLLVPCNFLKKENAMIVNYNKVEDFDDILEYLDTFITFNDENITGFYNESFLEFMIAFAKNLNPNILKLLNRSIFKESK